MMPSYAVLLKSGIILAGLFGFVVGFALGGWSEMSIGAGLFRGAMLCAVSALLARILLLRLFEDHVEQIKLRRIERLKTTKAGPAKGG